MEAILINHLKIKICLKKNSKKLLLDKRKKKKKRDEFILNIFTRDSFILCIKLTHRPHNSLVN